MLPIFNDSGVNFHLSVEFDIFATNNTASQVISIFLFSIHLYDLACKLRPSSNLASYELARWEIDNVYHVHKQ